MQDELNTTIREAIDSLHRSLDDAVPDWERVVADAEPEPVRQRRRPRSRRYLIRGALVVAATAVVAFGVLSGLPDDGLFPGTGPSSIARAASALTPADKTILHTVVVTTQTHPDGDTPVSWSETWQQTTPPYAARQLAGRELAQANGALQYYDPQTNTIHTTPPNAIPASPTAFAGDEGLRERMLDLLHSGEAHEDGHVIVGGRDAIRIVSSDGKMTLIVDAATYEPIEWSWVSDGVSETSRFATYEWLPATERNLALLSLTAQHPNATIRQDETVTGTDGEGK
jgi:hypothetical protein